MDELVRCGIHEIKEFGTEPYLQQCERDLAKLSSMDHFDQQAYEKAYVKAHAALSCEGLVAESSMTAMLLFLLRFCSETASVLHKVYISKTLLQITKTNHSPLTASSLSTLMEIYSVLIMSHSEVILHNVAASLLQSVHYFRDASAIERIEQVCALSEKFHLILLTNMLDNCRLPSFLKMSASFLQKSAALCISNATRQNSTISAKIIAKLAQVAPESILVNANDLFNHRDRFHNQACRSIFNSISPSIKEDINLNRKACAVDLAHADIDNVHHIYDTEIRCSALGFRSPTMSQEELLVSVLSVLADCSSDSHNSIGHQIQPLFESLSDANKQVVCRYLDCRSRVRASQLILSSLHCTDIHVYLYNIIMFSSFEELRTLAFKKLLSSNAPAPSSCPLGSALKKDGGWGMLMLHHFHGRAVADDALSTFRSICTLNFQSVDLGVVLGCLQGLLLICRLGLSTREDESQRIFSQAYPLVQACLDWVYCLCLTETPESCSLQNNDDDYECRSEWKIAKFCVLLIVDSMQLRSVEANYRDLTKVANMIANLKHRGAYFCLYESILQLATYIFANDCSYLDMFDSFCWDIIYSESDTSFCGRRGAGTPYIVKALLKSLPVARQSDFSRSTFEKLACASRQHQSEFIRVKCVNILCEIFGDKTLQNLHREFGATTFDLSFDLLASTSWAERNVGLRLFSAVYRREIDLKKDGDNLVDIRKLGKLPEILVGRLSTPHEKHIYPLLVCLSHVKIPAHLSSTFSTFVDAATQFLRFKVNQSNYYIASLSQRISTSLRIAVDCTAWSQYFDANGLDTWSDRISKRFVPSTKSYLGRGECVAGCSFVPDDTIDAFFDQFKDGPILYQNILSFLDEDVSATRRLKAARYMLGLLESGHSSFGDTNVVQIAYRLVVDDSEDIRFYGCKVCHAMFSTHVVCSPFHYIDRIWKHVGLQGTANQSRLFHSLFWSDFSRDLAREKRNMDEDPIFRSEPLNSYRDFFFEALMIKRHVDLKQLNFTNELSRCCSGIAFEASGYLMRSMKVLQILSDSVAS